VVDRAGIRVKHNGRWKHQDFPRWLIALFSGYYRAKEEIGIWWSYKSFRRGVFIALAAALIGYGPWLHFKITKSELMAVCKEAGWAADDSMRYACLDDEHCTPHHQRHTMVGMMNWGKVLSACPDGAPARPDQRVARLVGQGWQRFEAQWDYFPPYGQDEPKPEPQEDQLIAGLE